MNLKIIFVILLIVIAGFLVCGEVYHEYSQGDVANITISNNSDKIIDYKQADINLKKLWY